MAGRAAWSSYNPAVDTAAFRGTTAEPFWSSTRDAEYSGSHAWALNFRMGETVVGPMSLTAPARCVR
jgi:hypothetical protein